jgi:FADH2 O2-dependent halogenase
MPAPRPTFDYDLVVLGAGYTGGLMALVALAQGLRVLLVDKNDLPRFALGESTSPNQCRRLEILADRYGIPVLRAVASYPRIVDEGLPVAAWPKAGFYIAHHQLDCALDARRPAETMVQTSPWPTGPEPHVMREDLDTLLKDHAVEYGAVWSPHTTPVAMRRRDTDGAPILRLQRRGGTEIEVVARLVVDAGGSDSWLAQELDLRLPDSADTPMRTACIFLHMKGVGSWNDALRGAPKLSISRDHTTLQHLFDGGAVWQIGFDDGRVSLGLTQAAPLDDCLSAEDEFWRAMRRLPTLHAILADAEPLTPYYRLPDIHYGSKRMVGDGWVLMPSAAESSDPFLTAGLTISTAAVCRLARLLEELPKDEVVPAEAMAPLERQFRIESSYVRRVILTCRRGFADPELFQRGFFLYRIAVTSDGFALAGGTLDDASATVWGFGDPAMRKLVDATRAAVEALPRGRQATAQELAAVDAVIAANEPWPFSKTRFGALRPDRIYLASPARILDFMLKTRGLHRGQPREGALRSVFTRWGRGLLRPPRVRPSPSRPCPAQGLIRDQLRTMFSL